MAGGRLIDAVEAAYRLDLDDEAWLAQLTDSVEPLLQPDTGTVAYYFDLRGTRTELRSVYAKRAELTRPMQEMPTFNDPAQRTMLMLASGAHTISELLTPEQFALWQAENGTAMSIADSLGLTALDPDGKGVVISAGLLTPTLLEGKRQRELGRLAAHIATAYRLRRHLGALGSTLDGADAVLAADGRVEHARRGAKQEDARSALRRAVKSADAARARRAGADEERAIEAWKALVDGRWTLVDQFDSDGRRYWVAHPNSPRAPDPRRLTLRERQIAAFAAMGQSQKEIAYSLGVTLGTVGNHLSRAMQKLGVGSRVELVRYFFQLWLKHATHEAGQVRSKRSRKRSRA